MITHHLSRILSQPLGHEGESKKPLLKWLGIEINEFRDINLSSTKNIKENSTGFLPEDHPTRIFYDAYFPSHDVREISLHLVTHPFRRRSFRPHLSKYVLVLSQLFLVPHATIYCYIFSIDCGYKRQGVKFTSHSTWCHACFHAS